MFNVVFDRRLEVGVRAKNLYANPGYVTGVGENISLLFLFSVLVLVSVLVYGKIQESLPCRKGWLGRVLICIKMFRTQGMIHFYI